VAVAVAVGVRVAVAVAVAVAVGVRVAVAVAVGVAVGVCVAVAVAAGVAVGVPHGAPPLLRRCTSARNWKVCPTMPPTLQIAPPSFGSVPKNPAWLAGRLGSFRLGGYGSQAPAGQVATDSSSTRLVESKKPPP